MSQAHNRFCVPDCRKTGIHHFLTTEITSIAANIDTLKGDLKEKRATLKSAQKELTSLKRKKSIADAKAAEEVLKKLLASGMSADEILEKLK